MGGVDYSNDLQAMDRNQRLGNEILFTESQYLKIKKTKVQIIS